MLTWHLPGTCYGREFWKMAGAAELEPTTCGFGDFGPFLTQQHTT